MRKFLVITTLQNEREKLLNELLSVNFSKENFKIFIYNPETREEIQSCIRKDQPELIIIDGRGDFVSISNLRNMISYTTATFDIYTVIYSVYKETNLSGIRNIKIEDISRILESP